jgi:hypothetical protein
VQSNEDRGCDDIRIPPPDQWVSRCLFSYLFHLNRSERVLFILFYSFHLFYLLTPLLFLLLPSHSTLPSVLFLTNTLHLSPNFYLLAHLTIGLTLPSTLLNLIVAFLKNNVTNLNLLSNPTSVISY